MVATPASAGARFRQRKISTKQTLQILKQSHVPDLDLEDVQRDTQQVETGVEKGEEEEHHLQAVINATQAKFQGENVEQVFIPTPDASRLWPDATKYYPPGFVNPSSNIKFSCTVEETSGCPYNMDENDEEFLAEMNGALQKKNPRVTLCTELEFEIICHRFDTVIAEKQPFLTMAPDQIMTYEEIKPVALTPDQNSPSDLARSLQQELNLSTPFTTQLDNPEKVPPRSLPALFEVFGVRVYEHWKERRVSRAGKPVFPILKFEDPSDKDDSDPYVCFRRREVRQARKTRRQDQQSSERLRKLQSELKNAREMVLLVVKRELKRMESLEEERNIFQLRCAIKPIKRELGIKGDDDDLIAHKKKKPNPSEEDTKKDKKKQSMSTPPITSEKKKLALQAQQAATLAAQQLLQQQEDAATAHPVGVQPYVRLPASKIPDLDLSLTVSTVLREKNEAIKRAVHEKLLKRKEADRGFVNFTDDPYVPWFNLRETEPIVEYSHVPFSAIVNGLYEISSSDYLDDSLKQQLRNGEPLPGFKAFDWDGEEAEDHEFTGVNALKGYEAHQPRVSDSLYVLRKRVGRGGRVFVDRRGLFERPDDAINEFLTLESDNDDDVEMESEASVVNVYDCKADAVKRADERWRYDSDRSAVQTGRLQPFSSDPSKLNGISNDTQSIRFGSMLLAKSYEQLREATHQKQQQMLLARQKALQYAAQQQAQAQSNALINGNTPNPGSTPTANLGPNAAANANPSNTNGKANAANPNAASHPQPQSVNSNLTPQQIIQKQQKMQPSKQTQARKPNSPLESSQAQQPKGSFSPNKLTPEQQQRLSMLKTMQQQQQIRAGGSLASTPKSQTPTPVGVKNQEWHAAKPQPSPTPMP